MDVRRGATTGVGSPSSTRFNAVVAVRDRHHSGIAFSLASGLASRGGVPLTVFDVVDDPSPHRHPAGVHGRVVTVGEERAAAEVAAQVTGRDGALLIFDSYGGGPPGDRLFDHDAEHLLTSVRQPMLVVGPHARAPAGSMLLVPIDGSAACRAVLPVVVQWLHTFAPSSASVVSLEPPDPWPPDGTDPVGDPARAELTLLRRAGVHAELVRATAVDPSSVLLDLAGADSVLVVPGPRFPGSAAHWYSTARRLIRYATCPILVVPTTA